MKQKIKAFKGVASYEVIVKKLRTNEVKIYSTLNIVWNMTIILAFICFILMKPVHGTLLITLTFLSDAGYAAYISLRKDKFN